MPILLVGVLKPEIQPARVFPTADSKTGPERLEQA